MLRITPIVSMHAKGAVLFCCILDFLLCKRIMLGHIGWGCLTKLVAKGFVHEIGRLKLSLQYSCNMPHHLQSRFDVVVQ